jgi:Mrp family chromosome partitioning ATPase
MGEVEGRERAASLRDYLRIVKRRQWVILQALLLVPVATLLWSLQQDKLYEANAQVLIGRQNLAAQLQGVPDPYQNQSPDRVLQTQANLARVPHVAAEVVDSTGYDGSVGDFLSSSSVSPKANADLLEFKVRARSAHLAQQLATAYANEYRRYRNELDTVALENARKGLQQRLGELRRELRPEQRRSSDLYQNLVEREQELETLQALQISNASVVQRATDAAQVAPRPVRNAILGVALGLFLGLLVAFLWEALDTRTRTSDELERGLRLPLLGRLPAPPRRLRRQHKLITIERPQTAGAEAFRLLRLNIEFVNYGKKPGAVLVTSALRDEGKSTTAANLAVSFARSGSSVALVDLDLRRPYLHRIFEGEARPGLTEVALGRARLDDALAPIYVSRTSSKRRTLGARSRNGSGSPASAAFHLLAAGPLPPNPGEFVGQRAVTEIIQELRERFDVVLIDTPPVLQVGDTMAVAPRVDALLLVARLQSLRRHHMKELRRVLAGAPVSVIGFAVTAAETESGYGYAPYDYEPYDQRKEAAAKDVLEAEARS